MEETSTSTLTSKIEKTKSEINEVQKLENKKIKNKIKTINVISSKVDKQVFFLCYRQNKWWGNTKKNYLQNLKNLIATENPNKPQENLTSYTILNWWNF